MDDLVVGVDQATGQRVFIDPAARGQHLYLIGTTGTGKTTLLQNIVLADMKAGDGLCFLDPHGQAVDELLTMVPEEREDDVILWDPLDIERPFGLNLFECQNPGDAVQRDRVADMFVKTFKRIFPEAFASGPRMEELMRNMAHTFIENPGATLAETTQFLMDDRYRKQFLPQVTNPEIRERYWPYFDLRTLKEQHEIISSSLNKLGRFLANTLIRNIFGQSISSLDLAELMNQRKILLVRIPVNELSEETAELLGSILVGRILEAAFARGTRGDLPQFHLIVDEFHRFVSSAFPTLLAEARKFKLDVVMANQWLSQLEQPEDKAAIDAALSVKNKIVFSVQPLDAAILAKGFDTTPPPPIITGYKPKQTLSEKPWEELIARGHANPEIREVLAQLRELCWERRQHNVKNERWEWASQELEAEDARLAAQFRQVCSALGLLQSAFFGLENCFWSDIGDNRYFIRGNKAVETLAYGREGGEKLRQAIYQRLNPNYEAESVRKYLWEQFYLPVYEGLRGRGHRFPEFLPTLVEQAMEEYVGGLKERAEMFRHDVSKAPYCVGAEAVRDEFVKFFSALKREAVYRFECGEKLGEARWEVTAFPEVVEWLREKLRRLLEQKELTYSKAQASDEAQRREWRRSGMGSRASLKAEAEYHRWSIQNVQAQIALLVLHSAFFGSRGCEKGWELSSEYCKKYGYPNVTDRSVLALIEDGEGEELRQAIYRRLNPNYEAESVRKYLWEQFYLPVYERLRQLGGQGHRFPESLPTLVEQAMEEYVGELVKYAESRGIAYLEDPQYTAAVAVRDEFVRFFSALKREAVYRFECGEKLGEARWEVTAFPEVVEWLRGKLRRLLEQQKESAVKREANLKQGRRFVYDYTEESHPILCAERDRLKPRSEWPELLKVLGEWGAAFGNPYLLAREQGEEAEKYLEELVKSYQKTVDDYLEAAYGSRAARRAPTHQPGAYIFDPVDGVSLEEFTKSIPDSQIVPPRIEIVEYDHSPDARGYSIIPHQEDFRQVIKRLGDLLAQPENHILTESGQYEPYLDHPRQYTDVEAQIANELTRLPQYHARCKLGTDEVEIRTLKPDAHADYQRAERIRERSRQVYGRDRAEVERGIAERLQGQLRSATAAPSPGDGKVKPGRGEPSEWESVN